MDRWPSLVDAVDSVLAQLRSGDECLVIVDHNDELFDRAEQTFTTARVMRNTGPRGLSGARNTAISSSHGDMVAFLDDDAVACAGWLDRMRVALADPDMYAVGTAAVPHWPASGRPRWFPPEF